MMKCARARKIARGCKDGCESERKRDAHVRSREKETESERKRDVKTRSKSSVRD